MFFRLSCTTPFISKFSILDSKQIDVSKYFNHHCTKIRFTLHVGSNSVVWEIANFHSLVFQLILWKWLSVSSRLMCNFLLTVSKKTYAFYLSFHKYVYIKYKCIFLQALRTSISICHTIKILVTFFWLYVSSSFFWEGASLESNNHM